MPFCSLLERCKSLQKKSRPEKTGHKKFQSQFFPGQKILITKKIPRKISQTKKNSSKIFFNAKKFLKKILNAIIGRKKPGTRNTDYAIFFEIKPNTAFLYFYPSTRISYSLK